MMTIERLPDDCALRFQVLPAVWLGYRGIFNKFKDNTVKDFLSRVLQKGRDVPREKADAISSDFFDGSLHDFCVKHLDRVLKNEDHQKILMTAQAIIKSGKKEAVSENDDLIRLLACKVALNAHDASNHMLSEACFLQQYNALPPEGYEVLKRGISPVLYEDHDFYNKMHKSLKQATQNVPADRIYNSFNQWFLRYGFKCIQTFHQYGALIHDMRNFNALIVERAILNYSLKQRHPNAVRRSQSIRLPWRRERE